MRLWQKLLLGAVGKIRVHHGGGDFTDLHAMKLIYSGMNAQQKKFRAARKRARRQFDESQPQSERT